MIKTIHSLFWNKKCLCKHFGTVTIITILFGLAISGFSSADTGTYTLNKEFVDLTVQTDGNVLIKYTIEMAVHSGNIPWVTVGLPNSNFEIKNHSGNAESIISKNSADWTGVYITLDKTYYSGDTFNFSFEVLQKGFVYRYTETQASIQFIPSWWDNAIIEDLKITVVIPPEIHNVTTSSEPTRYEGPNVIWEWNNVAKGETKNVGVLMPLNVFSSVSKPPSEGFSYLCWIGIIVVIIAIISFIVYCYRDASLSKAYYDEPTISAGGTDKLTRHINMNCPNDSHILDRRTQKRTTVDYCDMCGGCFFDNGEIESLIRDDVNENDLNTNNISNFASSRTFVSKCPRCDGKMKRITKTVHRTEQSVYVCNDCKGIWMNGGTYQAIKDKRIEQENLAQLKLKNESDYFPSYWWAFYPFIGSPARYHKHIAFSGTSGHSSYSSTTCACVSCACAGGCACACACAGGGAAGCSPKDKFPQISF